MVSGVALGAIMPNQNNWLMNVVQPQARGRAAGVLTTFVFAGQFAGPLFAALADLFFSLQGIFASFAIAAGILSVGLMILSNRTTPNTATSH
jgi:MFS family permease